MKSLYEAPYGTDLFIYYDTNGNFHSYYDLKKEREVSLKEILNK